MPSHAFSQRLEAVLADAEELVAAHQDLRTGGRGRQWGLGALNRAVVVMCAAAWESYVEEVVKEAVETLRPAGPNLGGWPAQKAAVLGQVGRFNNPTSQHVRDLIATSIGLPDITSAWSWQKCSVLDAIKLLDGFLMATRHKVAHGDSPRPVVHNKSSSWLPGFVRRLARHTDNALRLHLVGTLGVGNPW
jgi:RiboL-PSP-HEPN